MAAAASRGDWAMLQWAYDKGCPCDLKALQDKFDVSRDPDVVRWCLKVTEAQG